MVIAMDYYSGHFLAIIIGFGSGHYLLNSSSASMDFFDPSSTSKTNNDDAKNKQNVNYDQI
jgi:hypothetical protein